MILIENPFNMIIILLYVIIMVKNYNNIIIFNIRIIILFLNIYEYLKR